MEITAAVTQTPGTPTILEQLTLADPQATEIVVEIAGTGICHTDSVFRDGSYPFAMPVVFGHEGAGVVVAAGSAVPDLAIGDHVVITIASCGHCHACLSARPNECTNMAQLNMAGARSDGSPTLTGPGGAVHGHFNGQSSFATHALPMHAVS